MPASQPASRPWAVLAICAAAQFMVVLDVSIVNVALPQMRHDLGLSITAQQWVVNAYTLTFAGFLMLGGRGADLFGRRRVFLTGLALFTAASLAGGLFVPLALFGLGVGTTFMPMTLTATSGVPPAQAGLASGLVNTTRQIGGAVGLAVLATLAAAATRDSRAPVPAALTAGYDRAFLVAGVLLLAGSGLALLIRADTPPPAARPAARPAATSATALTGTVAPRP